MIMDHCVFILTFICQVFKKAFIPRTLDEVVDFERDLQRVLTGEDTDLVSPNLHSTLKVEFHKTYNCDKRNYCTIISQLV